MFAKFQSKEKNAYYKAKKYKKMLMVEMSSEDMVLFDSSITKGVSYSILILIYVKCILMI